MQAWITERRDPIDEYYAYCRGRLPYRSLRFEAESFTPQQLSDLRPPSSDIAAPSGFFQHAMQVMASVGTPQCISTRPAFSAHMAPLAPRGWGNTCYIRISIRPSSNRFDESLGLFDPAFAS